MRFIARICSIVPESVSSHESNLENSSTQVDSEQFFEEDSGLNSSYHPYWWDSVFLPHRTLNQDSRQVTMSGRPQSDPPDGGTRRIEYNTHRGTRSGVRQVENTDQQPVDGAGRDVGGEIVESRPDISYTNQVGQNQGVLFSINYENMPI